MLKENLQKLQQDMWITDNPYDIKRLLMNKPKLYRILYDANLDIYMICDGERYIHYDMLVQAERFGYLEKVEEFIDKIGTLENYIDYGQSGGFIEDENGKEQEVESFLIYMVFTNKDDFALGDDGYDREYKYPFGIIFTRGNKLEDCELYQILEKEKWKEMDKIELDESLFCEAGYSGYSMSNNAVKAYEEGKKPLSKWTKADILERVKELRNDQNILDKLKTVDLKTLKNKLLYTSEWHHTSSWYNVTDFYEIDEGVVEDLTIAEIDKWLQEKATRPKVQYKGDFYYNDWVDDGKKKTKQRIKLDDVYIEEKDGYYIVTDEKGNELVKKKMDTSGVFIIKDLKWMQDNVWNK